MVGSPFKARLRKKLQQLRKHRKMSMSPALMLPLPKEAVDVPSIIPTMLGVPVEPASVPTKGSPGSAVTLGTLTKTKRGVIEVGIERGNRISIRWPAAAQTLTDYLKQKHDKATEDDLLGKIQHLTDGQLKKLIPCNLLAAQKILALLKPLHRLKLPTGSKLYKIVIDDAFTAWYNAEMSANRTLVEAHAHLLKDDAKTQVKFDFLKEPLYPWQTKGFQFIDASTVDGRGVFLCDDMGLGKTITVGAHLASQKHKAVVVCPASLCVLWQRKLTRFTNLSTFIIGKECPLDAHKYDVLICSYSYLKKRGLWPLAEYISTQKRVLVADEGHYARNYEADRTEHTMLLSEHARHTIVVTATPLVNRIKELHPLLRMARRLWTDASQSDFVSMYDTDEGQRQIAEQLRPFMVRRLMHEVWTDAPKGETRQAWVPLSNREDYSEAEKDFIAWLSRQGATEDQLDAATRGQALVKLNKLRQLAAQGKIEAAIDIINRTLDSGEQVVVFCAFNEPLFELMEHFHSKSGKNYKGQEWTGAACIVGTVLEKQRIKIIDDFQAGRIGLLLIGVRAGGHGIDLPIANVAYFLDQPWTPADFTQCTGRLLRLGQDRDCEFWKLLAKNTIDQRMAEIIHAKAEVFERAIDDQEYVDRVTPRNGQMRQTMVAALLQSYLNDAA